MEKIINALLSTVAYVVTHNGTFHADDVLAGAILRLLSPGIEIRRSRAPEVLAEAVLRFDVGGFDNPPEGGFDHHQRGGAGSRPNGIPYASAGLIWRAFGQQLCGGDPEVWIYVDDRLVAPVDAVDNGVNLYGGGVQRFQGVSIPSFSSIISGFNPVWTEEQDFDAAYEVALQFALAVLTRTIAEGRAKRAALAVVNKAASAAVLSDDPEIVVLDTFVPWVDVLALRKGPLYVVFRDTVGTWMVQCVPVRAGDFSKRKPLPAHWGGLPQDALARETGVPDAVFCHPALFICGARTREGAMRLARQAVRA